nr:PBP1A family penicillin-binding protein [Alteribacter populi]
MGAAFIGVMFVLGVTFYFTMILFGNYVIDNKKLVMNEASVLVDQDGDEITKLFEENREIISKDEIPEHVKEAFIAVEDQRFYAHQGIDFRAIGRALYRDILSGSKVEGGSTITQQLAKNTFLEHEKTWLRKTKEVLIAVNLEKRYAKEDILEMYLNRIYFGHGAHGIQAASQLYFNKNVDELTVEEGALLAALPKGPNAYSPIQHPERSKQRRDLVLSLMEQQGYLTADEAVRLQGKTIPANKHKITNDPAFLTYVDMALEEAEKRYQLSREEVLRGGYTIVVPMNTELQKLSYEHFQNEAAFPSSNGEEQVEGAFTLMDHQNGGVAAVQGGRDYLRQSFNRVNAKRQPGSSFKPPAVYAPALESGDYYPYSYLQDTEDLDFNGYSVHNATKQYNGQMMMYDAIKDSANVPAVWLLNNIGVSRAKTYLEEQLVEIEDEGLAMALGGLAEGISPLQLASLYSPFANGGTYHEPYFIDAIYDRNDEEIQGKDNVVKTVLSPQNAWNLTRMLEAVVADGTGKAGAYDGALAGKTGTTSFEPIPGAARDLWFAGFTPEYAGAIWMGYDRTDEEHYLTSASDVPTKLFKSIMQDAKIEGILRNIAFEVPEEVEDIEPPIRFVDIGDLEAEINVRWNGAHVQLNWTGSEDDRLHYKIYSVVEGQLEEVDQVAGESHFTVERVNPFSTNEFVVIPYSPQTKQEGPPSNRAQVSWRLFSQDAS